MNMELLTSLFANLALVSVLFMFAKWFIGYDMRWWLRFKRGETMVKMHQTNVYLEIKLPKEVFKTPASMEVVLLTLYQGLGHVPELPKPWVEVEKKGIKKWKFIGFTDAYWVQLRKKWQDRYLKGGLRLYSSLEIVSDEGNIKFYVVTKPNNKDIFKQYCFSQYPGVEINEVEDYTTKYNFTGQDGDLNVYFGRYATDNDKDHLPIKTYVDYGLDKEMVKEEFKIDPLVVLLEAMSQAKKGEAYWFQILIRPTIYNPKDSPVNDPGHPPYHWQVVTEKKIDELLGASMEKTGKKVKDSHGHDTDKDEERKVYKRGMLGLNPTEKQQVELMQKNIEKSGWDTVVRMFYIVDKKINPKGLDLSRGIMTVVNATKPFNKPGYNVLNFDSITHDSDYPFYDPTGQRTEGLRKAFWKFYKMRIAFYQEAGGVEFNWNIFKAWFVRRFYYWNKDWAAGMWGEMKEYWLYPGEYPHWNNDGRDHGHGFVLNTEELATLWHFPGKAFGNTESKVAAVKADPPSNLPI